MKPATNTPDCPTLYSFRRCPYAIRARMALRAAHVTVELREVLLSDKPSAMLAASPKGSVPVLVLADGKVIDESVEIMQWALRIRDPQSWLHTVSEGADDLIDSNDGEFKHHLDRYKYPQWHEGAVREEHREQAGRFLNELEQRLGQHAYLDGNSMTVLDVAIMPFVRQFAAVEPGWFATSPYPAVRNWLHQFLASDAFLGVMGKQPQWKSGDEVLFFP